MEITTEYRTIFAEEAAEHLKDWEAALLNLEKNPEDTELIHQMFRAVHTLKGSAGFIGFEKLQKLTHDLESALQHVRDDGIGLDTDTIDILFRGLDLSNRMVEAFTSDREFEDDIGDFLSRLWDQTASVATHGQNDEQPEERRAADENLAASESVPAGSDENRRYSVGLWIKTSGREAYLRAFLIRNRLSMLATIVSEDPPPEILRDSGGRFAYTIILETTRDEASLREALNVDLLEITSFSETEDQGHRESGGKGNLSKGAGTSASETIARAAKAEEVVRVSVERLDTLLNLVGELVIENSGFVSVAQQLKESFAGSHLIVDLEEKTENLAKITRDLQDGIMKVRMLPVNNVFNRFYRVVRDLAKDREKEINLTIFGEETEIDKKVMDRIADPLVHLIRNAVDHGIESREERLQAGKAPVGRVRLGAYQDGDRICIEISDDGRGLDRNAVLRKALEKGLLREDEAEKLSDEKVLSLIFLPGFSTAKEVSEVSGRGVGMDVVKRAIEGMGGTVRIRSFAGRGTTVTVALPLTMAIIPAVLVEVMGSTLAVPLSSVKEVLKVDEADMKSVGSRPAIRLREEVLSVVSLREALDLCGNGSEKSIDCSKMPVVIVDYEEKKIGLGVDRVLGTGEIVIKSLSRHYREIEGLIGASILGNGKIALIVDVEALVRLYHHVDSDERSFSGYSSLSLQHGQSDEQSPAVEESEPVPSAGGTEETGTSGRTQDGEESLEALAAELKESKGALLEEIHTTGAVTASISLTQLLDQEFRVSFPESQIVKLSEIAELLGGREKPVAGLYVGLVGDLDGGIMMIITADSVLRLHERLHRLEPESCPSIEHVDMSGISELGNILAASFINAMSDGTKLTVKSATPEISIDMCQPVIDSVLARYNQPGERIMLTKALIYSDGSEDVVCHLLMFLQPESLHRLMTVLVNNLE
jgi:two-component system chemotaxis sensor kinase CheA